MRFFLKNYNYFRIEYKIIRHKSNTIQLQNEKATCLYCTKTAPHIAGRSLFALSEKGKDRAKRQCAAYCGEVVQTYRIIFTPRSPIDTAVEVVFEHEEDALRIFKQIDLEAADLIFAKIELIYTLEK